MSAGKSHFCFTQSITRKETFALIAAVSVLGPWFIPHPTGHWVTLRRHPCLTRAATSASSQVNAIFCKFLLAVLFQFALGRPGSLLYSGTR